VDEKDNRIISEISSSSSDDSLTEKNITIGSKEMEDYHHTEKNKEQIILFGEENKNEKVPSPIKKRPKTPPKTSQPLISSYGPKVIPLTTPREDQKALTGTPSLFKQATPLSKFSTAPIKVPTPIKSATPIKPETLQIPDNPKLEIAVPKEKIRTPNEESK